MPRRISKTEMCRATSARAFCAKAEHPLAEQVTSTRWPVTAHRPRSVRAGEAGTEGLQREALFAERFHFTMRLRFEGGAGHDQQQGVEQRSFNRGVRGAGHSSFHGDAFVLHGAGRGEGSDRCCARWFNHRRP